jgi:hypothetical protein
MPLCVLSKRKKALKSIRSKFEYKNLKIVKIRFILRMSFQLRKLKKQRKIALCSAATVKIIQLFLTTSIKFSSNPTKQVSQHIDHRYKIDPNEYFSTTLDMRPRLIFPIVGYVDIYKKDVFLSNK